MASLGGSREALTEVVWFFFSFSKEIERLTGINKETTRNSCLLIHLLPQHWVLFPYSSPLAGHSASCASDLQLQTQGLNHVLTLLG